MTAKPIVSAPIVNKVAKSKITLLDTDGFLPQAPLQTIDIAQAIQTIPQEAPFRAWIQEYPWATHRNNYIGIHCSQAYIVPTWMYMLVSSALQPYARKSYFATPEQLPAMVMQDTLREVDWQSYADQRVMLKGCSQNPLTKMAYVLITQHIQPYVKSLMYGEPCSAVPIFKSRAAKPTTKLNQAKSS